MLRLYKRPGIGKIRKKRGQNKDLTYLIIETYKICLKKEFYLKKGDKR